eukprot:TRINITY_DN4922_c0_g1_i2.p1 TRINITY_DN4922_c0_g1~~TRINITY_DN4922_c0_g1_i2.p1  ORF type:complete len:520 (-),score=74.96 TRINITY_DN4922_c0_g1_i2:12-1571(-)
MGLVKLIKKLFFGNENAEIRQSLLAALTKCSPEQIKRLKKALEGESDDGQRYILKERLLQQNVITKSIFYDGVPHLRRSQTASSTGPSIPKNHAKAKFVPGEFKTVPTKHQQVASGVWVSCGSGPDLMWTSETSIQGYVKDVCIEIIRSLGLEYTVGDNIRLYQHYPDLVLLTVNDYPIAVIEVKKPSRKHEDALNDERVGGQMFDYLMTLRYSYGILDCFGILSDYETYKICWLEDNQLAAEVQIENLPELIPESSKVLLRDEEDVKNDELIVEGPNQRILYTTPLLDWSQKDELLSALSSVFVKIRLSRYNPPNLQNWNRMVNIITETSSYWSTIKPSKQFHLNYRRFPDFTKRNVTLILVAELGFGGEGKCWLACDTLGNAVALKFLHAKRDEDAEERLQEQGAHWKLIYPEIPDCEKTGIVTLAGQDVLAFPYTNNLDLKTVTKQEIQVLKKRYMQAGKIPTDPNPNNISFCSPIGKDTNRIIVFRDQTLRDPKPGEVLEETLTNTCRQLFGEGQ